MELAPGTVIDRYVVEAHLGRGGMADVYRVRHATLGNLSALKVLQSTHPGIRERLILEGRVQANLRHPNVVAVSDVIDVRGSPGLIMEYIAGSSLDHLIERHRLGFDEIDALARGILRGLIAAHGAGTIHRDLKPANILIGDHLGEPTPKITDFGLAKALSADRSAASVTKTGTAMGTPAYMAPEQIRNAAGVDHRADLFSMGAILYELVTGNRAFPGEDLISLYTRLGEGRYTDPRSVSPAVPDRMVLAIQAALRPNPAERPPTAAALLEMWVGAESSRPPTWQSSTLAAISQGALESVRISNEPAVVAAATYAEAASIGPDPVASLAVQSSLAPRVPAARVSATSKPPPPAGRSAWPWVVGTLVLLGVGSIGAAALFGGVAGAFLFNADRSFEEAVPVAAPLEQNPATEIAPEPAITPAPLVVAPVSAPVSAPTNGSAPPTPAPIVAPTEALPEAVPLAPAPVVAPSPAPEPAPAPQAALDAEIRVRHVLDKNMRSIERKEDRSVLVDAKKVRHAPGKVAAGTYSILTSFGGRPEIRSGTVYVAAGGFVNVTCFARQDRCEAE